MVGTTIVDEALCDATMAASIEAETARLRAALIRHGRIAALVDFLGLADTEERLAEIAQARVNGTAEYLHELVDEFDRDYTEAVAGLFTVRVAAFANYVLITVSGHLDEATAPQVREAVKAARVPGCFAYRSIAIDLTDAVVHGSKGLSPIVNAFFSTKGHAYFYLVAPSKMVRRVLGQISGGSLEVFSTVAELNAALAAESLAVAR